MEHNRGIGFGVFLLTVGVIWVLASVGVITWSIINSIIVLWPLLLVLIGVNIIFRRNGIIKAVAWVAFLAVIISYGYFFEDRQPVGQETRAGNYVSEEKTADIVKGELRIAFGGTRIGLDSDTTKLMEANLQDPDINYSRNITGGTASMAFDKKQYRVVEFNRNINNYNNRFHLNNEITWNLDIDTGAVEGNFDLTGLKVENLSLDTGAANISFSMGDKATGTRVKINAGASKIDFNVPKSAGVRVKMEGGLNSIDFSGIRCEKKDGYYISEGYDQAASRIDMDVTMGVGKFTVNFR